MGLTATSRLPPAIDPPLECVDKPWHERSRQGGSSMESLHLINVSAARFYLVRVPCMLCYSSGFSGSCLGPGPAQLLQKVASHSDRPGVAGRRVAPKRGICLQHSVEAFYWAFHACARKARDMP